MTESRYPEDTDRVEEIVQQHLQDIDDFEEIVQQYVNNSLENEARSNKEALMVYRGKKLTPPMVYAAARKYFEDNQ